MNKSIQTIIVALLCLNFCYGQDKRDCPIHHNSANLPYKYDFSGFRSGYKPGYRITDDEFMKGKSITVRNYSITRLFALALRLRIDNEAIKQPRGNDTLKDPDVKDTSVESGGNDTSEKQAISQNQVDIDVRQPEKLNTLYCFKLVVPFYLTDNFYVIMQQCLNAEFPQYTVKMERRGGADVMVIRDKEY